MFPCLNGKSVILHIQSQMSVVVWEERVAIERRQVGQSSVELQNWTAVLTGHSSEDQTSRLVAKCSCVCVCV